MQDVLDVPFADSWNRLSKKRKCDHVNDVSDTSGENLCYKQRRGGMEDGVECGKGGGMGDGVESHQHFYQRVTHQVLYAFYHRVGVYLAQTVRFSNGHIGHVSIGVQARNEAQALLTLEANDEILEQLVIPWWEYLMVRDVLNIASASF